MTHSQPFAITFATLALAGCPSSGTATGTLTATWSLENIDGSPAACTSGFQTMKVSASPWSAELDGPDPAGTPIVQLFDCAAGTGTMDVPISGELDLETLNGKADISWEVTDSTGGTTVATDLQTQVEQAVTVDLSGGSGSAGTTMYFDGGYAWFAWLLYGTTAATYLDSCAGAGVDKVEIALTDTTTMAVTTLTFPCTTADGNASGAVGVPVDGLGEVGAGIAPVKAGSYGYVATAFAGTQAVGTSDVGEEVTIGNNNSITIISDSATITLTNR